MSSKLVKKLLQVTATATIDAALTTTQVKKKKRGKRNNVNETPLVDETKKEKLVRHHISSLVGLDHAMASAATKSGRHSKTRSLHGKEKSKIPIKKATAKPIILGNSRSSSSLLQNQSLQPTVQKRAYQKQQKQKKLDAIAKLLQKTKKEMAKSNGTKSRSKSR